MKTCFCFVRNPAAFEELKNFCGLAGQVVHPRYLFSNDGTFAEVRATYSPSRGTVLSAFAQPILRRAGNFLVQCRGSVWSGRTPQRPPSILSRPHVWHLAVDFTMPMKFAVLIAVLIGHKVRQASLNYLNLLVIPTGFEPVAYRLGICRSILLSYGTTPATHNRFGRIRQPFARSTRAGRHAASAVSASFTQ